MRLNKIIDFKREAIELTFKILYNVDFDKEYWDKFVEVGLKVGDLNNILIKYNKLKEGFKNDLNIPSKYIPYFKMAYNKQSILGRIYLKYYHDPQPDYQTFINKLIKEDLMFDEYKGEKFTIDEVINIFNNIEVDAETKLALISFYSGGEKLFNEIKEIVNELAELYKKHYVHVKDDVESLLKDLDNPNTVTSILDDYFDGKKYTGEEEVYLSITAYNHLNYTMLNEKRIIYFGLYLREIFSHVIKDRDKEEMALNAIKTISDPTRYKILKLLKDEPKYASEIAKELDLSAATINHHINLLVNMRLIKVLINEEDNKKIFYEVNKEILSEVINIVRSNLL